MASSPTSPGQLRRSKVSAPTSVAARRRTRRAQLAARIDQLPAGGEGIIGALLIVFIVLLITDILGFTKVFPFTKPVK